VPEAAYCFLAFQNGDFLQIWLIVMVHSISGCNGHGSQVAVQQEKDAPLNRSG
jgi:hypothetical protein